MSAPLALILRLLRAGRQPRPQGRLSWQVGVDGLLAGGLRAEGRWLTSDEPVGRSVS
jgi:hypothetical protein